jgi:hypothetical protein
VFVTTRRDNYRVDIDNPIVCRICVRGRITASWQDRFEELVISTAPAPDGAVVTTLQGVLPDQAALIGILNSLYALRLAIVRVECLANAPAKGAGDRPE